MNTILLVSYFALWAVVIVLIFAFAIFARQIGLIHKRIFPSGARMTDAGPKIGVLVPALSVTDLDGRQIELGGEALKPTLLTFVSATCGSCSDLVPALRALWKNERKRLNFAIISLAGSEEENRQFIGEHRLEDIPFVLSHELGRSFKVLAPPYGVLLDKTGAVKAKGIVNRREHLESLLNADELNEPSMESYMSKRMIDSSLDPVLGTSK